MLGGAKHVGGARMKLGVRTPPPPPPPPPENPPVSRNRYVKIKRYFHLANNEELDDNREEKGQSFVQPD